MIRQPVSSSNVKSVGYDPVKRTLEIECHGGRVYQYDDVPPSVHQALMAAASHGRFFRAHIMHKYHDRRVR